MQKFIQLLENTPHIHITPPSNTIAHIFRHEQKENFISDWLAFLLNPEYTGSTEPLAVLLKLALGEEQSDLGDVSIHREYTFCDQRRIDFLIETNQYTIGIENKIWSDLQPNQLKDYQNQLASQTNCKKLVLILLCPKDNNLSMITKDELFSFNLVVYEDLVAEFKKIRFGIFENLRATVLMEDFIAHMEEYIMKNPNKEAINFEMWNFEANYTKEIQELLQNIEASKSQFGAYIKEQLSALIEVREDCEAWATPSIHTNMNECYYQLYKSSWKEAQVHFELLNKGAFPPSELKIVLHTQERKKTGKTDKLYNLENEVREKVFPISYETEERFYGSMDKILAELGRLVTCYTEIIDEEIAQAAISK